MGLFQCNIKQSDISNGLLDLCKSKVLSGSPTIPTVQSGRITINEGGFITESERVYFYIKGKVAVEMDHPSVGIGEFTLVNGLPLPYSQSTYPGFTGIIDKSGYYYDFILKAYNNMGSIALYINYNESDLLVGEDIVIYGFYITNPT